MTRFGELSRFLTAKKIIRPRMSKARIPRPIIKGRGMELNKEPDEAVLCAVCPCGWV